MVPFRRRLRGQVLSVDATAKVGRTAASQGIELLQLITQKVPQGGAANGAAEAGKQEVATGAGCRREMEGVIRGVSLCFHNGWEPGFLQNSMYNGGITNAAHLMGHSDFQKP